MAIRTDVTVDWNVSPRLLTVADPSTEITVQEIVDTCRFFEDSPDGLGQPPLIDAAGKEPLGGTTYVGITATFQNAYLAFEARSGPTWTLCIISGGNIVAVDSNGDELDPRYPTAYTTIDRTASASATLQEQTDLQFASYDGGVTYDSGSSHSGTDHPTGTPREPVNNFPDGLIIQSEQGVPKRFYIIGNASVDGSNDFSDFEFVGQSAGKSTITLADLANTTGVEVVDATVTGIIDGDNHIHDSIVVDLTYVDGDIFNCGLIGDIGLAGDATLNDCYTVDQDDPPIINLGGTHSLAMPNYSGIVTIKNLTDADQEVGIGLNHGMVIIDSTVTAGTIIVSGVGLITDNSTGAASINSSGLISNTAIANAVWADADALFLLKIIKNKKTLEKSGSIWQLIIYDDDDATPILTKDLKDKDDANITDLAAGALAKELQTSV